MWADHQVHVMRGDMWAELADLEKTRRTNQEAKANSARENSEPRSPELYRARVTKDFSQSGTWSFNGPVALKNVSQATEAGARVARQGRRAAARRHT